MDQTEVRTTQSPPRLFQPTIRSHLAFTALSALVLLVMFSLLRLALLIYNRELIGATSASKRAGKQVEEGIKNGGNLSALLGVMELCWGDVGLLLAMPRQGLGNAAIAAVANEEQLQRFGGTWAAMAITEPGCGSDSAAIRTTATQDGDHYVLNGEKIFVTSGERARSEEHTSELQSPS